MKTIVIGSKDFGTKNNPSLIAEKLRASVYFWEDLVLKITSEELQILVDGENILDEGYELAVCMGWYKNGKNSIYRDLALAVAKIFDAKGIKYWNSEMGRQRSTTKLSQMTMMATAGIKIPDSYFSLNTDALLEALGEEERFIVKATSASRGKNNFCVDGKSEVEGILKNKEKYFLIQEYIENDHDLRVICFGGKAKLALRRARVDENSHLNNTSQGGEAEWIEIAPELAEYAQKIAKLFGREMGGVDFIEVDSADYGAGSLTLDKNGKIYYCLEINAIPQLTSGTDVEKKMSALIKSINEEKS